jgi:hypothetical protein
MALYKSSQYLKKAGREDFDQINAPGTATPHFGIYRCESCGDEMASATRCRRKITTNTGRPRGRSAGE